jgi:glutathione S-transferase
VHIALDELKLPYEQEIVDLTVPRTQDYLKLNPRGVIPTLIYDGEVITESAVIATFLADKSGATSSLLPVSTDEDGPLLRARIAFFVDTYVNRVSPIFMKVQRCKSAEERSAVLAEFVDEAAKQLDPLLEDAAPFFGGSSNITLAEVRCDISLAERYDSNTAAKKALTAPFLLRAYLFPNNGLLPTSLLSELSEKAPKFDKWAKATMKHPSVSDGIWDEEKVVAIIKQRMGK